MQYVVSWSTVLCKHLGVPFYCKHMSDRHAHKLPPLCVQHAIATLLPRILCAAAACCGKTLGVTHYLFIQDTTV